VGAQYQLAKTLLALGRPEEAILHFETALKLSPELHQAGEGLQEARRQLQAGQERSKKK
jgi:tetratricopeptide (TPR) repeat protein